MGDHDDHTIPGDLLEDVHNLYACLGVQCTGRLVRQNDVRIVDQCTGNGDTLHLSAGHLAGLFVELVAQSHILKRLLRPLFPIRLGNAGERQRQFYVLQDGLVGNQVVTLKDKADGMVAVSVPVPIPEVPGRASVDDEVAPGVLIQSADDVQHGGLSAAGRPQNGDQFALAELQVDALEGVHGVFAGRVILLDAFEF